MTWNASPPRIEIAAVWSAALCLGGAVGFAVARTALFGAGLATAIVAGVVVALAGWALIGRVDRQRAPVAAVESLEGFLIEEVPSLDHLIDDEVLLLDDPLPKVDDDSRVVRLFSAQPCAAEASTPLAGPSEMIALIEDFLGQARGSAAPAVPARDPDRSAAEDASAALHAALADIRRSLRQG